MGRVLRMKRRRKPVSKSSLVQLYEDPRDTPLYGVREAAAYVNVPRGTLRHWLKPDSRGRVIIETPEGSDQLSFYNMLEAHALSVMTKQRGVTLPILREAVEKLRARSDRPHPLIENDLFTIKGLGSVYLKTIADEIEDLGAGGEMSQMMLRRLVVKNLQRIDRDNTGPYRLRPHNYSHIALDHRISGGRPVVLGTGILAEMIARRRRAGESAEALAADYHISVSDVREATRYAA